MHRILRGTIERFAEHYHGPKFHALLCDAPYEYGFMGKSWDSTGVSFRPETWAALAEHLHHGAFGMTFGGARTYHRMAVAIEDAGLIIHPMIFGWAYGSGFPKATRVNSARGNENGEHSQDALDKEASVWEGHRYGLQAVKPALEPIIVFQKPCEGKPVDCITGTGAGALWIDGGRIPHNEKCKLMAAQDGGNKVYAQSGRYEPTLELKPGGRWPANLYLEHHPDCRMVGEQKIKGTGRVIQGGNKSVGGIMNAIGEPRNGIHPGFADGNGLETVKTWECVESCPVQKLGEQSGERPSGGRTGFINPNHWVSTKGNEGYITGSPMSPSTGTASRFFFQSHWMYERLEQVDQVLYCGKATRKERDAGLGSLPLRTRNRVNPDGLENEPRWAPVEARNVHPSVKPIAVTKWIATLLLPPSEYEPRRLFVPFAGSGSEMIGALLSGWEQVIGIEMIAENVEVARARLEWWADFVRYGQDDPSVILGDGVQIEKKAVEQNQPCLF